MDFQEIEQLVDMVRDARISELTVSVGDARVSLRKPLGAPADSKPTAPRKAVASSPELEPSASEEPAAAGVYITAPMVGIFHSVSGTSAVGEHVKQGQVVGKIESMKLMNDVVSEHGGVIAEVLIEDGMPVEYGQSLFKLENT